MPESVLIPYFRVSWLQRFHCILYSYIKYMYSMDSVFPSTYTCRCSYIHVVSINNNSYSVYSYCFLFHRALFMEPTLLILDEPTNHLDLNAVIWLDKLVSILLLYLLWLFSYCCLFTIHVVVVYYYTNTIQQVIFRGEYYVLITTIFWLCRSNLKVSREFIII